MGTKWPARARPCRASRTPSLILMLLAAAAIVTPALLSVGCTVGPTETRAHTFTVGDSPVVIVESDNSNVEVSAGPDEEVHVQTTLKGVDRLSYDIAQNGDTITIDIDIEETRIGASPGADLTITAPAGTDVEIVTSNGSIQLSGIEGTCSLRSSNGKIALSNVKGSFEGSTGNGRLEVDGLEGTAELTTSHGDADLRDVTGEIDVNTSNGSISFSGNLTPGGSSRLVTSNGDVIVEFQGTPNVSLEAETDRGKVRSELEITATETGDKRLVGTIGDGEATLYVRTSNGDINVK